MSDKHLTYWSGKTVLITGGSSGIGFELASSLNGIAKHIVIVSHDIERIRKASSKLLLKENHSHVVALDCDVGDLSQVRLMAEHITAEVGCPDVLINNAGFAHYHTFDQMSEAEVEETANVNFIGCLRVTRAFVPYMIKEGCRSWIVNMASVAGAFPITPNSVYAASKAGMFAFSELLEIELRPLGIRVLTVCPGRVLTPFFDHDSYHTRSAGSETLLLTPIEDVVRGVIEGVALGRKKVFIPGYWRCVSWWLGVDRLISRPLYKLFLTRRVARSRDPNRGLG